MSWDERKNDWERIDRRFTGFLVNRSGTGVLVGEIGWFLCRVDWIGTRSFRDLGVCDGIEFWFSLVSTGIGGWGRVGVALDWIGSGGGGLFVVDGCSMIGGEGERGGTTEVISSFVSIGMVFRFCSGSMMAVFSSSSTSCASIGNEGCSSTGGGVGTRFFSFK